MEIVQWIVILLAIAFIFSRFMPAKGVENIKSSDAKQKMKDRNIQFIDVRTLGSLKQRIESRLRISLYPIWQAKQSN